MVPNVLKKIRPEVLDEIGLRQDSIRRCDTLIVTGQNGSGKSFLRRLFQVFLRRWKPPIEVLPICMEDRSNCSMLGIVSAFIYGNEGCRATSSSTIGAIRGAFRTSAKRENPHLIFCDEPEIGLSEEFEITIGEMMADFMMKKPKKLRGLVVTTHSRHVASALMYAPKAQFLNLGGEYETVNEWLDRPLEPPDPDAYLGEELARFRRITQMLKEGD